MRKILLYALITSSVISSKTAIAQNIVPPSSDINLGGNTGTNLTAGTLSQLTTGATDVKWQCSTTNPNGIGAFAVAASPPSQPTAQCLSWSPNQGAFPWNRWVTVPGLNCGGVLTNYSCTSVTDAWFRYAFFLGANPVLSINWTIFASDWVQDINVNGFTAYTAPASPPSNRQNAIGFRWCTKWVSGLNYIIIHVKTQSGLTPICKNIGLKVECWGGGSYTSISGPTFMCANTATHVYSAPSGSAFGNPPAIPAPYSWTKPPSWGWVTGTGTNVVGTAAGTTSGLLTVAIHTVASTGSVCIATGGYIVTVPPPLVITPSNTNVICSGKTLSLTVSGASSYTWTNPPGQTGSVVTVTPSVGGTIYSVLGGGTGCVYTKTLLVSAAPSPTVSATLSPSTICVGGQSTLQVTGNAFQYFMYPCGPATPSCQIFLPGPWVVAMPVTTIYTIQARNMPSGCTNTALATLSVIPAPIVSASANPSVVCPGICSTLTAVGASTYSWTGIGMGNPVVVCPGVSTTYTVRGFAGSCSATGTVQAARLSTPTVVVTPPAICPGIINTVVATGAISTSYTWTVGPPVNTVYIGTPSITINSSVAVSYTVIGSGANTCTAGTTGTIPLGAPIPITAPDVVLCTNGGPCTTVSATSTVPAVSFTWQPASTPASGSTVSVCPSSLTVYTVSASSAVSGCPNSATMAVSIASNCCPQPTAGMIPLTGLGGLHNNNSYVLSSPITLTASAFLQNIEILMTEGVSITVPPGMQLDMEKTHLFACGINMWQGIIVQDGGRITTSNTRFSNSLIEDAVVAIDLDQISLTNASPNLPIDVSRIIFNRNFIGIKISNSDTTMAWLPLGINGCVFTSRTLTFTSGTAAFLDWPTNDYTVTPWGTSPPLREATTPTTGLAWPYCNITLFQQAALKLPYSPNTGHIGIKIENISSIHISPPCVVDIGITYPGFIADDFNFFENITYGFHVTNASLSTKNNVFQNMWQYWDGVNWYGGEGIRHEATTSPNGTYLDLRRGANHFWDCVVGVNIKNVRMCLIAGSVFRGGGHNTATANFPLFSTQSDVGINYEGDHFWFTAWANQFNNQRKGIRFRTPQNVSSYGITADDLSIYDNYFGAQVTSTTPYSAGAGTSGSNQFMSEGIDIATPNTTGWVSTGLSWGASATIVSNKFDRVLRGISIDGLEDMPMQIANNSILLEEDLMYPLPTQFGISVRNNVGNMAVHSNTVDIVTPWYNPSLNAPTAVSALYFNNNYGVGSPVVECNTETNTYYGFQFEGLNPGTDWKGNTMCTNFAGLVLSNGGEIGQQGNSMVGNNNKWLYPPDCGNPWGFGNAPNETYCDNSDPTLSPIYVNGPPAGGLNPLYNSNNPFSLYPPYTAGTDLLPAAAQMPDCVPTYFNPPPNWRQTDNSLVSQVKDQLYESRIIIYPNPTNGWLSISGQEQDEVLSVSVFDLAGKVMLYKSNLSGSAADLDVSELAASLYVIEVKSNRGKTVRKKLVKTN